MIIGHEHPAFIIAEAGVNHNGDVKLAHELVDAAARCGACAVKFQTYATERLVSPKAAKAEYQRETTGAGSQFGMLKKLELKPDIWPELKSHCDEAGVIFMSSSFDEGSVDILLNAGVEILKLGSGELTNRPLIEHCSLSGLPTIMSTGMANRYEVEAALTWYRTAFRRGRVKRHRGEISFEGDESVAFLHCVSSYPAPNASLNLRAMHTLRDLTLVPIGFSDHSVGAKVPPLAVAAGACIVEKHITLDRSMEGPDHRASVEPNEFQKMVEEIREIEEILGHGRKEPHGLEADVRDVARKSIVALRDIPQGKVIDEDDVGIRRPGTGLAPARMSHVLGRKAKKAIELGEPIAPEWVELVAEAEKPWF